MVTTWVMEEDWGILSALTQALQENASITSSIEVKKALASQFGMLDVPKELGGGGRSSVLQVLAQFVCGYHDLDYRDIAHTGHGRMIVRHGSAKQHEIWMPKLASGSLVGVAATESHGGSKFHAVKTVAETKGGKRLLSGEKVHISRLAEADAFVVFFKFAGDEVLSAVLIDLAREGVATEVWDTIGLRGWSWGKITFDQMPFEDTDILGARGQGAAIFKEHLAYYRPMITMTTLGVAAAVLDMAVRELNRRVSEADIIAPRDSALETIARHYASINAGILSAVCAAVQGVEDSPQSSLWARTTKAWGIEQAYHAVSELALLMGAGSFRSNHFAAKALVDIRAFLMADGIHDALRRSAGRALLDSAS